ncbi:ELWxxDGT repeat protein [Haloferula sargassicola]|uniref:ELWxxDGT repeat protein n=1 Tax=Haloferula sargassicola TaxID=490096 RepID=UPI00336575C4
MTKTALILAVMTIFESATADTLVKDVNPLPEKLGVDPSELVVAGGRVFYTGFDTVRGHELWSSDGTAAGTGPVRDLCVGLQGSFPGRMGAVGERVFFFADDGDQGMGLWWSDGVEVMRVERPDGGDFGLAAEVASVGGVFYFTDGTSGGLPSLFGWSLWRTDGTPEGTWLLNPILPGGTFPPVREISDPRMLRVIDGQLHFADGNQVWRVGESGAAEMRADLGSGGELVSIAGADGEVWMTLDREGAKELWRVAEGPAEQVAVLPGGEGAADQLTVRQGRAFFRGRDAAGGFELWSSDGTTTAMVADLRAGVDSSFPKNLVWLGDSLCFTVNAGEGVEALWACDADGTNLRLIRTAGAGLETSSYLVWQDVLYFLERGEGRELWRSDGTAAGTWAVAQVATIDWWPRDPVAAPQGLFFPGDDGVSGVELWSSDGTPAGTGMVWDLATTQDGWVEIGPGGSAGWGNGWVFVGNDGVHGEEPWQSDGSEAGTAMLADVSPGSGDSSPNRFTSAGTRLFFQADDGTHGSELWRSDVNGTALVQDIMPGSGTSYVGDVVAVGERVFFKANDESGSWLWVAAGAGANPLKSDARSQVGVFGEGVLFSAVSAGQGEEPWWTDGETTRLLEDVRSGSSGSNPAWFTQVGSAAYFTGFTGGGSGLFRTDGTATGTVAVGGWTGSGSMYPLVAAGDRLYFFEEDPASGKRLWMAQGDTAIFLKQVGDEEDRWDFPATPYVVAKGTELFFTADDGIHGSELWRSDGSPEGTVMVADLRPGPVGSEPSDLHVVGGMVFFQANDGASGEELWMTDGTSAGTRLMLDVAPGSGGSLPMPVAVVGRELFFAATTEAEGREPHIMDVGGLLDFHHWSETAGLAGIAAAPGATPHGDGVANLLKYAFGLDGDRAYSAPTAGAAGRLPDFIAAADETGMILRVEYPRRRGDALRYVAKRSSSLANGSFVPMGGDEAVKILDDEWELVVRTERVEEDRCFGVVEVELW